MPRRDSCWLDTRQDPVDRARRAAAMIDRSNRRYLIVFDNFESLQVDAADNAGAPVENETVAGILRGLLAAQWRSVCLFTGRYRWDAFEPFVAQGTAELIALRQMNVQQAAMLMNNLPRLRTQSIEVKRQLYLKVGGHPKTLELLNGWLATGDVTDLLDNAQLDERLQATWEAYFLDHLLARLTATEREQLTRLAIFETRIDDGEFSYAEVTAATVRRYVALGLMQQEQIEKATLYTIHPVVRDYLLAERRVDAAAQQALHRWAAAFYGRPFVDAVRQAVQQSGQPLSEEQIESLARDRDGAVGKFVHQTQDMGRARWAMRQALQWQEHLFAAGAVDAASEIGLPFGLCWLDGGSVTAPNCCCGAVLRRGRGAMLRWHRAIWRPC